MKQSIGIEAAERVIQTSIKEAGLSVETHYDENEYAQICDALIKKGGIIKRITQIASTTVYAEISKRQKKEAEFKESHEIIVRSPVLVVLWKNENGWPVEFITENVKNVLGYTLLSISEMGHF